MIVNGFCKEVFRELPMEFAVEARSCSRSASKAPWARVGLATNGRHDGQQGVSITDDV
jgi:hypothetical protein